MPRSHESGDIPMRQNLGLGLGFARRAAIRSVNFVAEGDSLTAGQGASDQAHAWPNVEKPRLATGLGAGYNVFPVVNIGTSGIATNTMDTNYATRAGASFDSSKTINLLTILAGTNTAGAADDSALEKYQFIRSYLRKAQLTGYNRIVIGSVIARNDDGGANWTNYIVGLNAYIRTYWNSDLRCQGFVDWAADSRFSPASAANDTTYYGADKLHLNDTGYNLLSSLADSIIITAVRNPAAIVYPMTWSEFDYFNLTLSNGNKTFAVPSGFGNCNIYAIVAKKSGKWNWEVVIDGLGSENRVGLVNELNSDFGLNLYAIGDNANSIGMNQAGAMKLNGSTVATLAAYVAGDTIQICWDADTKKIWMRRWRSGVAQNWNASGSANPATGVGGIDVSSLGTGYLHPAAMTYTAPGQMTGRFAAADIVNAIPSGFKAFDQ